jgi:hypothetical protein
VLPVSTTSATSHATRHIAPPGDTSPNRDPVVASGEECGAAEERTAGQGDEATRVDRRHRRLCTRGAFVRQPVVDADDASDDDPQGHRDRCGYTDKDKHRVA